MYIVSMYNWAETNVSKYALNSNPIKIPRKIFLSIQFNTISFSYNSDFTLAQKSILLIRLSFESNPFAKGLIGLIAYSLKHLCCIQMQLL